MRIKLRVRPTPTEAFPWQWSGTSLEIGRGDRCTLRFRSELVSSRHALIEAGAEGAFLTDLGSTNGTFLNGNRVHNRTLLSSGDQIQLGQGGPRMEVLSIQIDPGDFARFLTEPSGPAVVEPVARSAAADPLAMQPAGPGAAETSWFQEAAGESGLVSGAVEGQRTRQTSASTRARSLAMPLAVGSASAVALLAIGVLIALVVSGSGRRQEAAGGRAGPARSEEPTPIGPASPPGTAAPQEADATPADVPSVQPQAASSPDFTPSQPAPEAAEQSSPQSHDAVLLIQVRQPGTGACWPFATCCAVDEHMLLTTATVALELTRFRDRGLHILVTPGQDDTQWEVDRILVHAAYLRFETRDERIYLDLALLTTHQRLKHTVPVITAQDSAELEDGLPVFCSGYPHEGMKVTKYDALTSIRTPGRVYLVTAIPEFPGHPRLLHIQSDLPDGIYGSPVLDSEGRVVAVYAESASPECPVPNLHYAPMVTAELIASAGSKDAAELWVTPPMSAPEGADPAEP